MASGNSTPIGLGKRSRIGPAEIEHFNKASLCFEFMKDER